MIKGLTGLIAVTAAEAATKTYVRSLTESGRLDELLLLITEIAEQGEVAVTGRQFAPAMGLSRSLGYAAACHTLANGYSAANPVTPESEAERVWKEQVDSFERRALALARALRVDDLEALYAELGTVPWLTSVEAHEVGGGHYLAGYITACWDLASRDLTVLQAVEVGEA